MDWTITSSSEYHLIWIEASGLASVQECQRLVDEVLSYAAWEPGTNLLIDCRHVNIKQLHFDQIDRSALILQGRNSDLGPCRIALITTEGVGYGIGRQFKFVAEAKTDIAVDVFVSEDSAVLWLTE